MKFSLSISSIFKFSPVDGNLRRNLVKTDPNASGKYADRGKFRKICLKNSQQNSGQTGRKRPDWSNGGVENSLG